MPREINLKPKRTRDEWLALCKEFESTKLTKQQFCENHNIYQDTLRYWQKKYGMHALNNSPKKSKARPFIKLNPSNQSKVRMQSSIDIKLPNSIELTCHEQTDLQSIKHLVEALS